MGDGGFFESMYRDARGDADGIPWASLAPSSIVDRWLGATTAPPGPAAVVACGLGDDAEALAAQGWEVTAFDVAPTAIDWARRRFPESPVDYVVADLFDVPPTWSRAFSLVVEVFTIQSIAPAVRDRTIHMISDLVAPGGTLLVGAVGHDGPPIEHGPPWPLTRDDLRSFADAGLAEVAFETRSSNWEGFEHYELEYRRPTPPGP